MNTHSEMMQYIESLGAKVVPGFITVMCFAGRAAAMEMCQRTSKIVTFFVNGQKSIMIPCVDGCAELPFQTKEECFLAYETLDEFGYLAYGGTKRNEHEIQG